MTTETAKLNKKLQRHVITRELRVQRDTFLDMYFNTPAQCANNRDVLTAIICQNEIIRQQNDKILSALNIGGL